MKLLKRCIYFNIQRAVDLAANGTRILVLPGVYRENPSRGPAPAGCEDVYARTAAGNYALTYEEHQQLSARAEPDRDHG